MFIPDLDLLPIPDPEVKKAPDPGSGSATLITSGSPSEKCFIYKKRNKEICSEHYENSFEI
jgi:hypothetical protein